MSQKERDSMRETVYVCMCVKERGTENVFIFFSGKKLKKKTQNPKFHLKSLKCFEGSVDTVSQSTLVIVAVSRSSLVVRVKNRASNNTPALQPADKAVVY